MAQMIDKELEQYQRLVKVPDKFQDGFGVKTVIGAVFMGFLMVPGTIYLGLFMGGSLGGAAQWVTVILFAEVVKRSMKTLREQEIFVLFYMTGMVLSVPFPLLWNQYFVQSPAAIGFGVATEIPSWVAPQKAVLDQYGRTFFTVEWMKPLLFMTGMLLIGRIDHFGLGYALYRWTAHVEKLPFPMAPVGALGVSALAETRHNTERWRWRCFSLGGVMGLAWGVIYTGIPAFTGAVMGSPVKIVPIPWLDLTPALSTERSLPAVPLNLLFDFSLILVGMVIPFWAIMGGLAGWIITLIANPMLYRAGVLTTWRPGMGVVDTTFSNHMDFYLSFGIGLMLAIFLVGLVPVFKPLLRIFRPAPTVDPNAAAQLRGFAWFKHILFERNRDRGDLSIFTGLAIYFVSTTAYILICLWMMPGTAENGYRDRFPWLFFMGFGFIYQPVISYINAKLTGLMGQSVGLPLVREASFILSGYKGATIWFAPIPLNDYGGAANGFRTLELTGTRLSSILKTEFLVFPILVLTTILFSEMIWRLAPVPSESYPFTQEVWHLNALNNALTITSTMDGSSPFLEAIKPWVIGWGLFLGLAGFTILNFLNLPILLVYGVVRGMGQTSPGAIIPEIIGALIGRYYFQRKIEPDMFKRYMMILMAGFSAGVGLIGMAAVAFALIAKSTSTLGY